MVEYKKEQDEFGDPVCCYSCEYPAAVATFSPKLGETEEKILCQLCANTLAGNAFDYPRHYEGECATLKTICYVGNLILEKLDKS